MDGPTKDSPSRRNRRRSEFIPESGNRPRRRRESLPCDDRDVADFSGKRDTAYASPPRRMIGGVEIVGLDLVSPNPLTFPTPAEIPDRESDKLVDPKVSTPPRISRPPISFGQSFFSPPVHATGGIRQELTIAIQDASLNSRLHWARRLSLVLNLAAAPEWK